MTNSDDHRVNGVVSPSDFADSAGYNYCSAMRRLEEELHAEKEANIKDLNQCKVFFYMRIDYIT